jgi:hypothetical protein
MTTGASSIERRAKIFIPTGSELRIRAG